MTAQELRDYFNKEYGITKEWPHTFEVDIETYENCLAQVEDWQDRNKVLFETGGKLLFKNVELILNRNLNKSDK